MTSKEKGSADFDAEAFYREGVEDAGGPEALSKHLNLDPESQEADQETAPQGTPGAMSQKTKDSDEETQQAEQTGDDDNVDATQAALDSTEDEEADADAEVESVISNLLPSESKPEQKADLRVPVEEHIKLRQRAQQAEKERDELRQRLETASTQTGGEKPGTEEPSPLEKHVEENPDDDFVPASVQLAERKWQDARTMRIAETRAKAHEESLQAIEADLQRRQQYESLADKSVTSEKAVRKAHVDYDVVTKAAINNGLLSDAEKRACFDADSPAEVLYQTCKTKVDALRSALGIQTTEPQEKAPAKEDELTDNEGREMTDDEIFAAVYGTE